jgi:hypothetical protein
MKKTLALVLLILVSCIPSPLSTPTTTSPLPVPVYAAAPVLINPGFEEGWHLATTYWTLDGGPFHDQFVEITPPAGWTAWWIEGPPCAGTDEHNQRRPEVRVISEIPDPARIHSGDQALKFFTFWGCHRGGVYQQVTVEPGKHYTVQAFVHTWFSNCSAKPHYQLPLDYDCKTPILWAQDWLRICIDPQGDIDPTAPSVVCSTWEEVYGDYGDPLRLEHVLAISSTATVILESIATHPLKHDDVYWDDISISESYQVFLPIVATEG